MSQVPKTTCKRPVVPTHELIFAFLFRHDGVRPAIKAHYVVLPGCQGETGRVSDGLTTHPPPCYVSTNRVPGPNDPPCHRTRYCSGPSLSIGFSSLPTCVIIQTRPSDPPKGHPTKGHPTLLIAPSLPPTARSVRSVPVCPCVLWCVVSTCD